MTGLALDVGTIYNTSSTGASIKMKPLLRASAGIIGVTWISPFGPVKFFYLSPSLRKIMIKRRFFVLVLVQLIRYLKGVI